MLFLLACLAIPLCNVVMLSFYRHSANRIWVPQFTLDNYQALSGIYFISLGLRTLKVGVITTCFCILLGYPVAYYFARAGRRALVFGMFVLFMPLMVSAVVGAFGWIVILGRNGILNSALKALHFDFQVQILYSEIAVVIALVNLLLPMMVLPLMASIEKIPRRLEEVAVNLGASPLLTFWRVVIPLSMPGLISGSLLCFTIAISAVVTPRLLGGNGSRMIGTEIYEQVVTAYNWPFASSLAVVLVAIIVFTLFVSFAAERGRRQRAVRERR
jgi:ABC-type spermidine/putrescine transport system permease subunit I